MHITCDAEVERVRIKPPQRTLCVDELLRHSLVLIVGASGSGKSTLLRWIEQQNPELFTLRRRHARVAQG